MRKPQITGRALTKRRDRWRVVKGGLNASSFRAAIGSGFQDWISSRWGLAGTTLLSPARKTFLKPFSPPDILPGPGGGPAGASNYTILSLVQMKLALGVSNRMFLEGSTYISHQGSSMKMHEQLILNLSIGSILREFRSSLSQSLFRAPGRDQDRSRDQSLSFIGAKRWPEIKAVRGTHHPQTGLRDVVRPALNELLHSTQRWLRFLTVTMFRGMDRQGRQQQSTSNGSLVTNASSAAFNLFDKEEVLAWPALVLRNVVNAAFKAGDQLSQHWSLPGLVIPRTRMQASLAGGPFSLPPLTLVVPQHDSKEIETNIRTRFAESSTMYFAKRESQLVEGLVNALKEVRQTETQIKTVAPPQVEIEHLTRQVYQQLERELRIEKERRGL